VISMTPSKAPNYSLIVPICATFMQSSMVALPLSSRGRTRTPLSIKSF
jgi:hypothetical protein